MKIFKLIGFVIAMVSCGDKTEVEATKYFDLKNLFTNQINRLKVEKPTFRKSVELNGKTETKELSNINWAKELEQFVNSDLNKPAFTQSYQLTETDSTIKYQLKNGEKKPISLIFIVKKENLPVNIKIVLGDENFLYRWNKTLTVVFEEGKLKKYNVVGAQKILIFDEEKYQIVGVRK